MKVKKPFVLAVLILALLAVALIVPAVASGASDNRPVMWATYGISSNNNQHPFWQGQVSFHIAELPGPAWVGFVQTQTVRHYPGAAKERGCEFEAVQWGIAGDSNDPRDESDPVYGLPYVKFVASQSGKLWLGQGEFVEPVEQRIKIYAVDGGTGNGGDWLEMWVERGFTDPGINDDWPLPSGPGDPLYGYIPLHEVETGNIEFHVAK